MKTQVVLDLAEITALLRISLPVFGLDLDNEVQAPVQIKCEPHDEALFARPGPGKSGPVMVWLYIRAAAPWLPEGSYKRRIPCHMLDLREYLQEALLRQGANPEMLSLTVNRIPGARQLVAQYLV